jgi:hypothetical protein
MKNGVLDRKIWLQKVWRAQQSFQKVLVVFVEFLSGCKIWSKRTGALAKFVIFFSWIFGGFL